MTERRRFLVVEDEPLIAMMLEDFLDAIGADVAGVASGVADALRLIETVPIDAAILDVNLTDGERSDAVADMLERRGIPFVLSTGQGSDDAGGRPVLCKPFSLDQLERAVAKL